MRLDPRVFALLMIIGAAAPATAADEVEATWLYVLTGEGPKRRRDRNRDRRRPDGHAFSDRPKRLVRTTSVEAFVDDIWPAGNDSFASDPPNAALVVDHGDQVSIDTLASVERAGRTVSFAISVLDGGPPEAGSRIALVIDYGSSGPAVPDRTMMPGSP